MTDFVVQHITKNNAHYLEELFVLNKARLSREFDIKIVMEHIINLIEDAGHQYIVYDYLVALKNKQPISCMAAVTRKYHNSWYIVGMKIRPGFNVFDCRTNGIRELMTTAVEEAERIGYYSYNFMAKAGTAYLSRFHKMQGQIEALRGYDYYTELYIPANSVPAGAWYQAILDNRTWNFDCIIRTGMLRDEYRNVQA